MIALGRSESTPVSDGWVRNPDWLELPVVEPGDKRFVGLFLVFEDGPNVQTIFTNNGLVNIDWGDGNSEASTAAANIHTYDYSTISGTVFQYYDGRNYKQVIVDCTLNSGTATFFYIDRNYGLNNGGGINFVDIAFSWSTVTGFLASNQRRLFICEQFKVFDLGMTIQNNIFKFMFQLKSLVFPFAQFTSFANSSFEGMESFGILDLSLSTSVAIAFSPSRIRTIDLFDVPLATSLVRTFEACNMLQRFEANIDACTSIIQMCNGCNRLTNAILNNCGNLTATTNAFLGNNSLTSLLMNGSTVGFTVANSNMDTAGLDALSTSLDNANGAQTVIYTGTPGAATADTTILTGKGYTAVI